MSGAHAVELVAIGDELMLGDIVDTNSAWLGRRLAALGLRVVRRSTVGDDAAGIRDAVGTALERTGLVVCTGGLGPTRDDITKPIVAELFDRPLRRDAAVLDRIRRLFESHGRRMPETNLSQADVPEGAIVLPNPAGTAPGLVLEDAAGRAAVLLPGVPGEMRALFDEHLVGWLHDRGLPRDRPVRSRLVRTTGLAESEVAARVDDVIDTVAPLSIAFLPSWDGVDLRITDWGALSDADAERALDRAEAMLGDRLGDRVYGGDGDDLAAIVGGMLADRGLTLAVAESCTGGLVGERLTARPGASAYLLADIVAYANGAKRRFLGVEQDTLAAHGAVSAEVAREMVEGVRRAAGTDAGIAVTGVAGPGGGTEAKPVGTVWFAAAVGHRSEVRHARFPGDRAEVRARSAQAALDLLRRLLLDGEDG